MRSMENVPAGYIDDLVYSRKEQLTLDVDAICEDGEPSFEDVSRVMYKYALPMLSINVEMVGLSYRRLPDGGIEQTNNLGPAKRLWLPEIGIVK